MSDTDLTAEPATDPPAAGRRSRVAPFVALGIAAVFALLFVVFARSDPNQAESADTPLLGNFAPAASGRLDSGATFDLARRKGNWVVLNFFDSTCVPCVQEHPELLAFDAAQDGLGADGAELVTIVWGDSPDGAREFFAENGIDWPLVFDDDGSIATSFGVTKVPETWVVDPNGIVVWRTIAMVTASSLGQQLATLRSAEGAA